MDKQIHAVVAVLLGIGMGITGTIFFYQKMVALSFPMFIGIAFVVLLGFSTYTKSPPTRRNLWLAVPLLFFALMISVRAESVITILNYLAVFWLGAMLLHYWRKPIGIDQESFFQHAAGTVASAVHTIMDTFPQLTESSRWLRGTGVGAVGRGLILTAPVVGVFGLLLISADSKFTELVFRVLSLLPTVNRYEVFANGFFIFGIGWLTTGALAYSVLRQSKAKSKRVPVDDGDAVPIETDPQPADAAPRKKHPFLLGMVESGIMLSSVNLLFAAFVMVQFAYFFGGSENITAGGWSYVDYARRGFFELVATSVIVLGLILWLDWVTVRSNTRQHTLFRALSIAIIAMTGVMLLSAHLRLDLYEQRDGYTHLRLYTHVFMGWLGILFVFLIVHLFRSRTPIFSLGFLVCVIGYLMTMNLINADATLARANIARAEASHELEVRYLFILSTDAVPEVLSYYQRMENPDQKAQIGEWLETQRRRMNSYRRFQDGIFEVHFAHETAWLLLSNALAP